MKLDEEMLRYIRAALSEFWGMEVVGAEAETRAIFAAGYRMALERAAHKCEDEAMRWVDLGSRADTERKRANCDGAFDGANSCAARIREMAHD